MKSLRTRVYEQDGRWYHEVVAELSCAPTDAEGHGLTPTGRLVHGSCRECIDQSRRWYDAIRDSTPQPEPKIVAVATHGHPSVIIAESPPPVSFGGFAGRCGECGGFSLATDESCESCGRTGPCGPQWATT